MAEKIKISKGEKENMRKYLRDKLENGKIAWGRRKTEMGKDGGGRGGFRRLLRKGMETEPGIDGILVTVGLCIIALLLCVVMKDSLQKFIETLVTAMTTEAQKILTGVSE